MWGQPIKIAYQQHDLSLYTKSMSTTPSSRDSHLSLSTISQSAATATLISAPEKVSNYSTGSKAGIGVGVAGGILFLLGFAFFLARGRTERLYLQKQRSTNNCNLLRGQGNIYRDRFRESPDSGRLRSLVPEIDGRMRGVELSAHHDGPVAEVKP